MEETVDPALGEATSQPETKVTAYKGACLRLGFFVSLCFLLRIITPYVSRPIFALLTGIGTTGAYALTLIISALACQIIPAVLAVFILKYGFKSIKENYRRPKNHIKAVGNFPALYGFGMTVNIITMTVIQLVTSNGDFNESFNPVTKVQPPTLGSSLILFVVIVIIAPVFEEFIFRGAVLSLLKPYGNGVAVFTSAFLFGLYHGNFSQFFYAFALGICFGYIAVVTKSIYSTTLLHAFFNSIGAILMVFLSTDAVNGYFAGEEIPDGEAFVLTLFAIFGITVLITAVIGFIMFIVKLAHIRRYSLPAVWTEIGNGRKILYLLLNIPALFAVLLVVDEFGGNFISNGLIGLISGALNG